MFPLPPYNSAFRPFIPPTRVNAYLVTVVAAALDDALEHTLSDEELTERSHTLEADK